MTAGPAPTEGWDVDRFEAAHLSSCLLESLLAEVSSCITTGHGHGLAVPGKAVEGFAALQALAGAWANNSHGTPATDAQRAALGLQSPPTTTTERTPA